MCSGVCYLSSSQSHPPLWAVGWVPVVSASPQLLRQTQEIWQCPWGRGWSKGVIPTEEAGAGEPRMAKWVRHGCWDQTTAPSLTVCYVTVNRLSTLSEP